MPTQPLEINHWEEENLREVGTNPYISATKQQHHFWYWEQPEFLSSLCIGFWREVAFPQPVTKALLQVCNKAPQLIIIPKCQRKLQPVPRAVGLGALLRSALQHWLLDPPSLGSCSHLDQGSAPGLTQNNRNTQKTSGRFQRTSCGHTASFLCRIACCLRAWMWDFCIPGH